MKRVIATVHRTVSNVTEACALFAEFDRELELLQKEPRQFITQRQCGGTRQVEWRPAWLTKNVDSRAPSSLSMEHEVSPEGELIHCRTLISSDEPALDRP